jgi:catechol 2,3-dioxygenase-like lactoylglutathione lyase family enzyme
MGAAPSCCGRSGPVARWKHGLRICEESSFTSLRAGASYLNLIAQPAERRWSWWGRVIFYVADVDALYDRALAAGYQPTTVPRDAEWGERFFHLIDPDGHELSFARPLLPVSVQ